MRVPVTFAKQRGIELPASVGGVPSASWRLLGPNATLSRGEAQGEIRKRGTEPQLLTKDFVQHMIA